MEVAGARDGRDEEDKGDPGIQGVADDSPQPRLAEGAGQGESIADKVELGNLCRPRKQPADVAYYGMEADVEPAPYGVVGRVLPGLEAVAVGEVVSRLPVVECLVAVLDRGK